MCKRFATSKSFEIYLNAKNNFLLILTYSSETKLQKAHCVLFVNFCGRRRSADPEAIHRALSKKFDGKFWGQVEVLYQQILTIKWKTNFFRIIILKYSAGTSDLVVIFVIRGFETFLNMFIRLL